MLKAGAFVAMLLVSVLCASLGRLAAEEPSAGYRLPDGSKAVAVRLSDGEAIPDDAKPGMEVDIVGTISDPIKTGIALLNVKLLAFG